jgi:hypothetical protein
VPSKLCVCVKPETKRSIISFTLSCRAFLPRGLGSILLSASEGGKGIRVIIEKLYERAYFSKEKIHFSGPMREPRPPKKAILFLKNSEWGCFLELVSKVKYPSPAMTVIEWINTWIDCINTWIASWDRLAAISNDLLSMRLAMSGTDLQALTSCTDQSSSFTE